MKLLNWTAGCITACLLLATGANADVLYTDGPADHFNNAWDIDVFYAANSFTLSSSSIITGVNYGAWDSVGTHTLSVDWAILNGEPTGGAVLASGTALTTGIFIGTNPIPLDVYAESFSIAPLALTSGTYWLQLSNAVNSGAGLSFWEMNGGPSQAWYSPFGDVTSCGPIYTPNGRCSNTFEIIGTTGGTAVPEPLSLSLLGAGLAGAAALRRRRKP